MNSLPSSIKGFYVHASSILSILPHPLPPHSTYQHTKNKLACCFNYRPAFEGVLEVVRLQLLVLHILSHSLVLMGSCSSSVT